MAKLDNYFVGTVATATPQVLDVDPDTPENRAKLSFHRKASYQITVTGAGTLSVETKVFGQDVFQEVASLSAEAVHLDLIDVEQIQLTASVADVPTVISPSSS